MKKIYNVLSKKDEEFEKDDVTLCILMNNYPYSKEESEQFLDELINDFKEQFGEIPKIELTVVKRKSDDFFEHDWNKWDDKSIRKAKDNFFAQYVLYFFDVSLKNYEDVIKIIDAYGRKCEGIRYFC